MLLVRSETNNFESNMKCPACLNELTEKRVGSLTVDVCQGGCGGIWFDLFELKQVDEATESAGEALLHIERDEHMQIDSSRKRDCPRCADIKLKRHWFAPGSQVEVDECPNCGGYWLDFGELEKIRAERTRSARADQARQAGLSSEVIRYLYRMKTANRPQA